jgi:hypothetical protein
MFKIKLTKKELGSVIVDNNAVEKNPQRVHSLLKSITSDLTKNHIVCTEVSKCNLTIGFRHDEGYSVDILPCKDGRKIVFYHEDVELTKE